MKTATAPFASNRSLLELAIAAEETKTLPIYFGVIREALDANIRARAADDVRRRLITDVDAWSIRAKRAEARLAGVVAIAAALALSLIVSVALITVAYTA